MVSTGAALKESMAVPVFNAVALRSYAAVVAIPAGWTDAFVIVTSASVLKEPGSKLTLTEPSAFVTVPPIVAEMSVGGPRASVDDAEPVGGVPTGSTPGDESELV